MPEFDTSVGTFHREWLCTPDTPGPDAQPATRWLKRPRLTPLRVATCPLCGVDVGFAELFGYFGHLKPGAPSYERWVRQQRATA